MLSVSDKKTRAIFIANFKEELLVNCIKVYLKKRIIEEESKRLRTEIGAEKLKLRYANQFSQINHNINTEALVTQSNLILNSQSQLKEKSNQLNQQPPQINQQIQIKEHETLKEVEFVPSIMSSDQDKTQENQNLKQPEQKQTFNINNLNLKRTTNKIVPSTRPLMSLSSSALNTHENQSNYGAYLNLNLGRIIPLLRENSITSVECQGENIKLGIRRNGMMQTTEIVLNREEINQIIKEFSDKTRIPLIEGLLKARIGNLTISAIISKEASSRFIITKTPFKQLNQPNYL